MHPRHRLQRIIRESEQFIADVQSWNDNHQDAEPFDCEPERIIVDLARRALTAFESGDRPVFMALIREISAYGARLAHAGPAREKEGGE